MMAAGTGETDGTLALAEPSLVWWQWMLLGLLLAILLIALAWAFVAWRRRARVVAPAGSSAPSLASRLPRLWRPFYESIPDRALHYPTVVVMGRAGAGKTHALSSHVDWRGQANQFHLSVHHDAALQLYLGSDVVVHELSEPLLRDVSGRARRALRRLWRRMGPSATVVLVVDARTLLTTPPAALRELAQLVRGKIGLFPRRCRASLGVRVLLSHLDQVEGYEVFAAAVGADHEALDLAQLGPDLNDGGHLLAAFDQHLAYVLTTRSGAEFDRAVRFYETLRALLTGLRPLLAPLRGDEEPYAEPVGTDGLYLGSLAPRSHVGKPFRIARDLIAESVGRQRWRGLRGGLAVMACGTALVVSLMGWHLSRIRQAEAYLDEFKRHLHVAPSTCAPVWISAVQTDSANAEAAAIQAVKDSEILWLPLTYVERKHELLARFGQAIRTAYLHPESACADRVRLIYLVALIHAARSEALRALVTRNSSLWAKELGLSGWVVEHYIATSPSDSSDVAIEVPAKFERSGDEWSQYLDKLQGSVHVATISAATAGELRPPALLRSAYEYQVLAEVRRVFAQENILGGRLQAELVEASIDLWDERERETLNALATAMNERLPTVQADTRRWGLKDLVDALKSGAADISRDFEITVHGTPVILRGAELSALFERSSVHVLLHRFVIDLPAERRLDGRAFFSESDTDIFPDVGDIKGYGGGPKETLAGIYTRLAFRERVAPVLRFAKERLAPALPRRGGVRDDSPTRRMTFNDVDRLDSVIDEVTRNYAVAYRRELLDYYLSMELDPGSELTLPFVFKAFTRPSSWFTDYLMTVATNASLELPGNVYFEPLGRAVAGFRPLVDLLAEKDGELPGLEPYMALLASLQPFLTGTAESRDAAELRRRLTPLGALTLKALQEPTGDHEEQIVRWLTDAGLDAEWHVPFLAPVQETRALGLRNIEAEVARAWKDEVEPLVRPLLDAYPFDPSATMDVDVDQLELLVRAQGKEPGEFWAAFERLIAPATTRAAGERVMLDGLSTPPGMLAMTRDLERTSRTLWDADGNRAPLKVILAPLALPREAHEDRLATMAYLRSGGAAVYGFNQRPEPQRLEIQWWNQGISVVALEMRHSVGGADTRTYMIEADGAFSFYRLLDRGEHERSTERHHTLTTVAIGRATRCVLGESRGSKAMTVRWNVPVGEERKLSRGVRMVLKSDPWLPFAVRDCR